MHACIFLFFFFFSFFIITHFGKYIAVYMAICTPLFALVFIKYSLITKLKLDDLELDLESLKSLKRF